jgi:3-oxoadipate enol-lactonase
VKVNGKDLAVEVGGHGPAVLLVHGLGGTSNFYQPQADVLAESFQVIRPDLEGSGRSPATGELSIDGLAADLAALLDALGLVRVALVGASFGGLMALALALREPDRAAALVLLDAPLDEFDESDELVAYYDAEEALLESGDADGAVELNVRFWVDRDGRRAAEPAVRDLVRTMQRDAIAAQDGVAAELEAPDPPVAGRLGEITVPALVAVGADDVPDIVRVGERLAEELPGAGPLVRIPGAAHLPALERPDEVAALVIAFLDAPHSAAG